MSTCCIPFFSSSVLSKETSAPCFPWVAFCITQMKRKCKGSKVLDVNADAKVQRK
ncbi:hypothetical protein RchiOBHm_Chr6g0274581 [Rosa chinensis]|uniref:Uncharacterized protein n=1 Tax=Rosa chinensis TaxID=74649 RepID=A0A2P6PRR5_ROSCH|nr:hypothetical protein RchiOBHm_Chr6g0274581 [Rosa chinensis]